MKRIFDVTKVEAYLAQYTGDAGAEQTGDGAAGTPDLALNVPFTAENWTAILNTLENAGVQVRLDLSDCKPGTQTEGGGLRSDGVFAPNTGTDDAAGYGIKYIAELILPRAASALADGTDKKYLFRNFDNLQAVSGENITNTGRFTFLELSKLQTAQSPEATVIGDGAFETLPSPCTTRSLAAMMS